MTLTQHEPSAAELQLCLERVIHDIQTRMQALIASADVLHHDCAQLDPNLCEAAEEVLDNALALETLVHTAGDSVQPYEFEPLRLEEIVKAAVNIYRHEARRRWIHVRWAFAKGTAIPPYPPRDPLIQASSVHLRHAINNLVNNAVKFSFEGDADNPNVVEVSGYPDKDRYSICISNYGFGILPSEIESGDIFADRYQGEMIREHFRIGCGKGLYFVKQVVDRHQGRIEVSSRPCGGDNGRHFTRFCVSLPYYRTSEV